MQSQERLHRINGSLGNQAYVQQLGQKIRAQQQKLSRNTYKYSRDSRNIKEFAREWKAFKQKMKYQPNHSTEQKPPHTPKRFGVPLRYDENATLELEHNQEFEFEPKPLQYRPRHHRLTQNNSTKPMFSEGSIESRNGKGLEWGKGQDWGGASSLLQLRRRMLTVGKEPTKKVITPTRFRHITTWGRSPQRSDLSLEPLRDKYAKEEPLLDFGKERTVRYIRTLHRLQWSSQFLKGKIDLQAEESTEYHEHMRKFRWQQDLSISGQSICYMISRRYQLLVSHLEDTYEVRARELSQNQADLSRQRLCSEKDYSTLNALRKNSILDLLGVNSTPRRPEADDTLPLLEQKQREVTFSLPYSEFISYRQTRKTVYQLITMSHKMYLRMAFVLLDKNRNQLIDESDLLHLIGLSRSLPLLTKDALLLSKALLQPTAPIRPYFRSSKGTTLGQTPKLKKKVTGETYGAQMKQQTQDASNPPSERPCNRFKVQKLYTFLTDKDETPAKQPKLQHQHQSQEIKNNPSPSRSSQRGLNFQAFCSVFRHTMPFIIYDMLFFMFGAIIEDFHPRIKAELKNQPIGERRRRNYHYRREETLQQKWNARLIETNRILEQFLMNSQSDN